MKYTLIALLSLTISACQPKLDLASQDAEFEAYVRESLIGDIETQKAQQEMGFTIELLDVNNYRLWTVKQDAKHAVYAADSTFKIVFKGTPFTFTVTDLFHLTGDNKIDYDSISSEEESYAKYEEAIKQFMLHVVFNQ